MFDFQSLPARDATGALQFWRHAQVTQALRDPRLLPHGQTGMDSKVHGEMRRATHEALAPARLAAWHDAFAALARQLMPTLPVAEPVDLVSAIARPWSLQVALLVTGVPQEQATHGAELAEKLYLAAATATDGTPRPEALHAATTLAQLLAQTPARQNGIADVQTFVALAQTLPALLAGAWRALLHEPAAIAALRATPAAVTHAVDELLRLGSPVHAVFREAAEETHIGPAQVGRGERVTLLLAAANRDPARFPDPERLDLTRDTSGQLGLGGGVHSCAGAMLVRQALIIATQQLLALSAPGTLALLDEDPSNAIWYGGFALRSPASVRVIWRGPAATPPAA